MSWVPWCENPGVLQPVLFPLGSLYNALNYDPSETKCIFSCLPQRKHNLGERGWWKGNWFIQAPVTWEDSGLLKTVSCQAEFFVRAEGKCRHAGKQEDVQPVFWSVLIRILASAEFLWSGYPRPRQGLKKLVPISFKQTNKQINKNLSDLWQAWNTGPNF